MPSAPDAKFQYVAGYCGEHRFALEQRSPITATPWISSIMPGAAKFDTVISALAGKLPSGNISRRIATKRSPLRGSLINTVSRGRGNSTKKPRGGGADLLSRTCLVRASCPHASRMRGRPTLLNFRKYCYSPPSSCVFAPTRKNARGRAGLDFLSKRGLSAGLRESPRVARVRTGRSAFNFANDGDQVFGDGLIYGCRKPNAQAFTDCVRNQIACRTRRVSRWHDPHGIVLMPVPSSSRTVVLAYRQPPSGAMVALSVRLFRLEFNFTQGTGVPATASPKRVVQKRSPHPDGARTGASRVWCRGTRYRTHRGMLVWPFPAY